MFINNVSASRFNHELGSQSGREAAGVINRIVLCCKAPDTLRFSLSLHAPLVASDDHADAARSRHLGLSSPENTSCQFWCTKLVSSIIIIMTIDLHVEGFVCLSNHRDPARHPCVVARQLPLTGTARRMPIALSTGARVSEAGKAEVVGHGGDCETRFSSVIATSVSHASA